MSLQVRSYEVDWQGIVNNATYLQFFEAARVAYLERIGLKLDVGALGKESNIVVARNEIDYESPARFGEQVNIYTRIAAIGNSSFTFEGVMEEAATGRLIARNVSVHVWRETGGTAPTRVPDDFRALAASFEGRNFPAMR
jgi:acyl-CoA thioester hydrolase